MLQNNIVTVLSGGNLVTLRLVGTIVLDVQMLNLTKKLESDYFESAILFRNGGHLKTTIVEPGKLNKSDGNNLRNLFLPLIISCRLFKV